MKQKTMVIMFGIIAALIVAIGGLSVLRSLGSDKFEWSYMITTDSQWTTLESDGGSNTNVYYLINFEERQIQKCEDKYFAPMHKYDYKGKVLYEKEMDEKTAARFKEVLDKIWNGGDATEGTYDYYTIEKQDGGPRYIHNKNSISQIQMYTNKFDKLAQ